MNLTNMLRGVGGEFELNRVIGALGVTTYIAAGPLFVAWDMARGRAFDLIAFCTAYPAGLGVAIGAVSGAVALKDRSVATAKLTTAQAEQAKGEI